MRSSTQPGFGRWSGPVSASGHKRTFAVQRAMSALPPIATAKADVVCVTPAVPQKELMQPRALRVALSPQALLVCAFALRLSRGFLFGPASLGCCPSNVVLL